MKVNEYGNVALKALKNYDVYQSGQIAGFPPKVAERLIKTGAWVEYDVAKAVVVKSTTIPAEEPAKVADGDADDAKVDELSFITVDGAEGEVSIPSDWADIHHQKRMAIAKAITGAKAASVDEADAVIKAAIESATTAE